MAPIVLSLYIGLLCCGVVSCHLSPWSEVCVVSHGCMGDFLWLLFLFSPLIFLLATPHFYTTRVQQRLTMCAQRNNIFTYCVGLGFASLSLGSYGVSSRWLVGVVALRLGPGVVGVVCAPDRETERRRFAHFAASMACLASCFAIFPCKFSDHFFLQF